MNFYVQFEDEIRGPYESWYKAYFAGLEIFGFDDWTILERTEEYGK